MAKTHYARIAVIIVAVGILAALIGTQLTITPDQTITVPFDAGGDNYGGYMLWFDNSTRLTVVVLIESNGASYDLKIGFYNGSGWVGTQTVLTATAFSSRDLEGSGQGKAYLGIISRDVAEGTVGTATLHFYEIDFAALTITQISSTTLSSCKYTRSGSLVGNADWTLLTFALTYYDSNNAHYPRLYYSYLSTSWSVMALVSGAATTATETTDQWTTVVYQPSSDDMVYMYVDTATTIKAQVIDISDITSPSAGSASIIHTLGTGSFSTVFAHAQTSYQDKFVLLYYNDGDGTVNALTVDRSANVLSPGSWTTTSLASWTGVLRGSYSQPTSLYVSYTVSGTPAQAFLNRLLNGDLTGSFTTELEDQYSSDALGMSVAEVDFNSSATGIMVAEWDSTSTVLRADWGYISPFLADPTTSSTTVDGGGGGGGVIATTTTTTTNVSLAGDHAEQTLLPEWVTVNTVAPVVLFLAASSAAVYMWRRN